MPHPVIHTNAWTRQILTLKTKKTISYISSPLTGFIQCLAMAISLCACLCPLPSSTAVVVDEVLHHPLPDATTHCF